MNAARPQAHEAEAVPSSLERLAKDPMQIVAFRVIMFLAVLLQMVGGYFLTSALARIENNEKAISSQRELNATQKEYDSGMRLRMELLEARREIIDMRINAISNLEAATAEIRKTIEKRLQSIEDKIDRAMRSGSLAPPSSHNPG